jgi:hypothetical protein
MPKNKPLPTSNPLSVEEAWDNRDKHGVLVAIIKKYARVLDMTDSGRDIKPLASGMLETIAQLEALESSDGESGKTPLSVILGKAS